jgi:hypothetical protein
MRTSRSGGGDGEGVLYKLVMYVVESSGREYLFCYKSVSGGGCMRGACRL